MGPFGIGSDRGSLFEAGVGLEDAAGALLYQGVLDGGQRVVPSVLFKGPPPDGGDQRCELEGMVSLAHPGEVGVTLPFSVALWLP
jgi:hypothetical protein